MFGAAVNMLLGVPVSHIGGPGFKSQLCSCFPPLVNADPEKAMVVAQAVGSLPHTWAICTECLAPASAWPAPGLCRRLESEQADGSYQSITGSWALSLCFSNKIR